MELTDGIMCDDSVKKAIDFFYQWKTSANKRAKVGFERKIKTTNWSPRNNTSFVMPKETLNEMAKGPKNMLKVEIIFRYNFVLRVKLTE